jgi:hypothetical protein
MLGLDKISHVISDLCVGRQVRASELEPLICVCAHQPTTR